MSDKNPSKKPSSSDTVANDGVDAVPFDLETRRGREMAAIVRKARRRGTNQSALARLINRDQSTISRVFSGQSKLSDEEVAILIEHLEIKQLEIDNFSNVQSPPGSPESKYKEIVISAVVGMTLPLDVGYDIQMRLDAANLPELADLPLTQQQRLRVLRTLIDQGLLTQHEDGRVLALPRYSDSQLVAVDGYARAIEHLVSKIRVLMKDEDRRVLLYREVQSLLKITKDGFELDAFLQSHRHAIVVLAGRETFSVLTAPGVAAAAWLPLHIERAKLKGEEKRVLEWQYAEIISLHMRHECVRDLSHAERRRVLAGNPLPVPAWLKPPSDEYQLKSHLRRVLDSLIRKSELWQRWMTM